MFIDVPDGWTVVHLEDTREVCLEYIEADWTDMRPLSPRAGPDLISVGRHLWLT
ncbi:MbtH family NRPS accessory protein [Nonomuraea sp. NPDC050451]|uniref:MbtH family NRPS accessory protein n=1 Tax=Nonomuraea sp. NPDC050451 TaxID=3364364 RepID=UPI003787A348